METTMITNIMKNIAEARFWVTSILLLTVIVVLLTYPKMRGKGLLILFSSLSLVTIVGFKILTYLLRSGVLNRSDSSIPFIRIVFYVSSIAATACLLGYVISIKEGVKMSKDQGNQETVNSVSEGQGGERVRQQKVNEKTMATNEQEAQPDKPLFLYISPARLILLSIASMSLYEAYWIYKNWQYIKERDGLNISPFWRGVFGVFFCHGLLRRIHEDQTARSIQAPSFSPSGLATGWVILAIIANIVGRVPSIEASIISAFIPSFLCLVPVQNYINAVTEKQNAGQKFYGWSLGHIICLAIGIIIWSLLLIGLAA